LRAVDSHVGRIGQLACWEHYNPLARYAMMADGEQIHSAMYPGSIFGDLFSEGIWKSEQSGSFLPGVV
jgi:aliphatic nitrilase